MCTNPYYITNPKLKDGRDAILKRLMPYDVHLDKHYIACKCGCCGECIQEKINEHATRAYYEFLDVTEYQNKLGLKGSCFMNALTYNEDSVPRKYGLMTFSSRHRQLFLKRLRTALLRKGYCLSGYRRYRNKEIKVSYLKFYWCCEYGDQFSRPHYHILIYCYFDIDPITLCKLVDESWQYGYTQFTNPYDKIYYQQWHKSLVNGEGGAIQYVTKYASKGADFLRALNEQKNGEFLIEVNKIIDKRNQKLSDDDKIPNIDYVYSLSQLRGLDIDIDDCLPYQKFSHRFGLYAIEKLSDDQLLLGRIPMPDQKKGNVYTSIQYLDNKLFYDYINNGKTRIPNSMYHTMKDLRTSHNIDYVVKDIYDTLESIEKMSKYDHSFRTKISSVLSNISKKWHFPIPKNISAFRNEYLGEYIYVYELAVYNIVHFARDNYKLDLLRWSRFYPRTSRDIQKMLNKDTETLVNRCNDSRYLYIGAYLCNMLLVLKKCLGSYSQRKYLERKRREREDKLSFNYYNQNLFAYEN